MNTINDESTAFPMCGVAGLDRCQQTLDAKSIAGILLREHDNIDQAIRYAERMAQRHADSRSLMAIEYQDAAEELKAWKNKNKHH